MSTQLFFSLQLQLQLELTLQYHTSVQLLPKEHGLAQPLSCSTTSKKSRG